MSAELALFGRDLFDEIIRPRKSGPIAERFEFPPFSVLNARVFVKGDGRKAADNATEART